MSAVTFAEGPGSSGCAGAPEAHGATAGRVAALAKLLSDPVRVQLLDLLRSADGEVCQCHLQPLLSVSQPTLSHHLAKLADGGLVRVERRGRWAYYETDEGSLAELASWLLRGGPGRADAGASPGA